MSEELEIIATYNHPADCEIVRARLESEGIVSYAYNEKTIQVDPLLSPALGGVLLKVSKEDAERAKQILLQPVEIDDEYKEFFKETQEDIDYKNEQNEIQKWNQNATKWGCIGFIIAIIIVFICLALFS